MGKLFLGCILMVAACLTAKAKACTDSIPAPSAITYKTFFFSYNIYYFDRKRVRKKKVWRVLENTEATSAMALKSKRMIRNGRIIGVSGVAVAGLGVSLLITNTTINATTGNRERNPSAYASGGVLALLGAAGLVYGSIRENLGQDRLKMAIKLYNTKRQQSPLSMQLGIIDNNRAGLVVSF
jgi:hypothetical protein